MRLSRSSAAAALSRFCPWLPTLLLSSRAPVWTRESIECETGITLAPVMLPPEVNESAGTSKASQHAAARKIIRASVIVLMWFIPVVCLTLMRCLAVAQICRLDSAAGPPDGRDAASPLYYDDSAKGAKIPLRSSRGVRGGAASLFCIAAALYCPPWPSYSRSSVLTLAGEMTFLQSSQHLDGFF